MAPEVAVRELRDVELRRYILEALRTATACIAELERRARLAELAGKRRPPTTYVDVNEPPPDAIPF